MARVLIVGGGASGLVTAIYAAYNNNEVILIDKNNSCGKKILITGNGKCNYWNRDISLEHYNSSNLDILDKIITDENKMGIEKLFDRLGIVPKIRDNYYYPNSSQATSIQTALILEAKLSGVEICNNEEVLSIIRNDNSFVVRTNKGEYYVDKVVLATGSKASSKTGSTGYGYDVLNNFGHTIVEPLPALVQLRLNESFLKDWSGIRSDVSVKLYENNQFIKEECGEIQLTLDGVSGICVFQLSSLISRGLYNKYKEEIEINFLRYLNIMDEIEFIKFMDNRNSVVLNRDISQLLDGVLNYKLINLILKLCKINRESMWDDIRIDKRMELGKYLTKMRLNVVGTRDFDSAQVCSGGLKLDEVNPYTMESKIVDNLYVVGELLDVDGECGGFNLGFAWISGYLAGIGIGEGND